MQLTPARRRARRSPPPTARNLLIPDIPFALFLILCLVDLQSVWQAIGDRFWFVLRCFCWLCVYGGHFIRHWYGGTGKRGASSPKLRATRRQAALRRFIQRIIRRITQCDTPGIRRNCQAVSFASTPGITRR